MTIESNPERRYRRHEEVATRMIGNDLLLVQLAEGAAFRLNPIGAAIWELAANSLTAAEIAERLHSTFGVSTEQLQLDASQLLEELAESALLERQPEAAG